MPQQARERAQAALGGDLFLTMANTDPELLRFQRPRCPKCTMRMITTGVSPGPDGFERRTFECLKCGHTETKQLPVDPVKTHIADGWSQSRFGQKED
jgi:hypothetical protein